MKKILMIIAAIFLFSANIYAADNANLTVDADVENVPLSFNWDAGAAFSFTTFYTNQTYAVPESMDPGWTVKGNAGANFKVVFTQSPINLGDGAWLSYTDGDVFNSFAGPGEGSFSGTLNYYDIHTGSTTGEITFSITGTVSYN